MSTNLQHGRTTMKWNWIKTAWRACFPPSVTTQIDEQIYACSRALITNQGTADHYQALANGCKVTLDRLRAMKAQHEDDMAGAGRRHRPAKHAPQPAEAPAKAEVKTPAPAKSVRRVA